MLANIRVLINIDASISLTVLNRSNSSRYQLMMAEMGDANIRYVSLYASEPSVLPLANRSAGWYMLLNLVFYHWTTEQMDGKLCSSSAVVGLIITI